MNRYSKILHHISPSKKSESPKSSNIKKRTYEEYEAEQKKTELDRLQEKTQELQRDLKFLQDYVVNQYEQITNLKEEVKQQVNLNEGLLNEPPETRNSDPLTPLNQQFVTLSQLSDHYQLFINRISQQLATLGGGGETQLKYLDDIVGIATNPEIYNGKYLSYNHSTGKFEFINAPDSGSGSSYWVSNVSGIHTSSNVGIGTDIPRGNLDVDGNVVAISATFTGDVSSLGKSVVRIISGENPLNSNSGILGIGRTLGFIDTGLLAHMSGDTDNYCQMIIQNHSTGTSASADLVLNNDQEVGYNYFLNLGINGSNYIGPNDAFSEPNGGYLLNTGASLSVGTADPYDLKLCNNGYEVARVGEFGVGIGTTIITSKFVVNGDTYVSGVSTSSRIIVNDLVRFTDSNVSIGNTFSGYSITTGYENVFIGLSAGKNTDAGCSNNFFGVSSGYVNTMGSNNNFIGPAAGYNNLIGFNNNFFGYSSGYNNSEGYYNNFIGDSAGYNNTFGNFNNFFGKNSGYNNQTGSYNIAIGYNVNLPILNGDNQLVIGKNTNFWIVGNNSFNIGIGTTNPTSKLTVGGDGKFTGIVTASSFVPSSGFVKAPDGTNSFYMYSGSGNVSFQGTIGVNQINSGSGYKVLDFSATTTPFLNVSNGLNVGSGSTIVATTTTGNVGLGTTNPTAKLDVRGDMKVGVNTSQGLILTDENGVAWRLIVNTNGTLSTVLA